MAGRGRQGASIGWGVEDMTFFKSLMSSSSPTGKSIPLKQKKFPHPRRHIAIKYPKDGPKKVK